MDKVREVMNKYTPHNKITILDQVCLTEAKVYCFGKQ
jgi:hypothetical protein